MMKILQFKLGGEYDYNVTFETFDAKRKIQTNELPKGALLAAIANVVTAEVEYFRLEGISASFRQITFSYPENSCTGFVIELKVKTKENIYIEHILKSEKLNLASFGTETDSMDDSLRCMQNNSLVEKIITLREEIEAYALGARVQGDLPFNGDGSDVEGNLFDDDVR